MSQAFPMSELHRIVLTSSLTVFAGITVFVVGQWVVKFVIEPLSEQAKITGEITYALIYYANIYMNPGSEKELNKETSEALRRLASRLLASTHAVPCYRFLHFLRMVRKKSDVVRASRKLIGLSNTVSSISFSSGDVPNNRTRKANIIKGLGIKLIDP